MRPEDFPPSAWELVGGDEGPKHVFLEDLKLTLRRLEINGFKSFITRLDMEFSSSGITAIIGPNGCGKTNIVDAIRWVMGEQKTRLLRNTKMENVIFNGTKLRKPLGMAEVHITLSNEDRSLPIDYSEVTLSRRIHRSGLSEYCLNGELTRLRTIKGILMDTGLGNHAYAIIEREMIDAVLNEKEQDKRCLFEEAAGIMRYRIQREEALRKIKQTELDLLRLGDILSELEKEVRSLRYQAAKARRFARLKERVDALEGTILKSTLFELLEKKTGLEKEKAYHQGITLTDENEVSILESRLQELRIRSSDIERKLQELHESRYSMSQSLQQHEEKIAVTTERNEINRDRIEEDDEEVRKARERLVTSGRDLALYRDRVASKRESFETLRRRLSEKEVSLRAISEELEAARNLLRERKQLALDLVEAQAKERGMREYLQRTLDETAAKRGDIERQMGMLRSEEAGLRDRLSAVIGRADGKREQVARLEAIRFQLAEQLDRQCRLSARCDETRSEIGRALGVLKEKRAFLEKIKQEHCQSSEEVQRDGRIKGILADFVKVKREHRKCFEACLASILQSLLAESKADALACLDEIKRNGSGRKQILYPDAGNFAKPDLEGEGIVGSALSLVECDKPIYDYLALHLYDVSVVEDVETAISLLEENGIGRIATLDGVFFDGPGRIVVAGSEDIEPTILEYNGKIGELDKAISIEERRALIVEARRERLAALRNRMITESARVRAELRGEQRSEERIREEQRDAEIGLIRVREKVTSLTGALEESNTAIAGLRLKLQALTGRRDENANPQRDSDDEIIGLEDRILALEREREALRESVSSIKLEEATIAGEISTLEAKMKTTEELEAELIALIEAKEEDAKRCRLQIALGEDEIDLLRESIARFHGEKDGVEKKIEEANRAYQEIDEVRESMETELKEIKTRRDRKKENLQRCTVELAALEARIASLVENARESFGEDLSGFVEGREALDPAEWKGIDRDELASIKEKIERFGPVNMLAAEEYAEKRERLDFLTKQKQDLEEARESLLQAIRKINREARRLLSETFEEIRVNFRETFQTLFGGGEADLLFVDSDDPLEANIKIVANPKGKRLHDISSLSGGERALTALSLLFAVYLVKPSPFCVFDEVDAPLDDANVARFVRMLRAFTDKTQFIVITHNKRTMEAADYLYGITMEEPGVSTLISVKLAEVDRFRERKPVDESTAEPDLEEVGEGVPVQHA